MEGTKRMNATDKMHIITSVTVTGLTQVILGWSDGIEASLDLGALVQGKAFAALRDAEAFARVAIGDWGHSLVWASGAELGADRLWLETLSATGHGDARTFVEWRLQHGLSLSKAAEALGLSRRMIAYYSNGEKPIPRPVLLACKGWEVETRAA
jgi:hypothetical protein